MNEKSLNMYKQQSVEPIAVIGMACRIPGEANTTEAFWNLLVNEVDAISIIPADRFDTEAYFAKTRKPGRVVTREGGIVTGIEKFDPMFFGISPREATFMDPQQRLLLEMAWEALEDAGQVPANLAGSKTGVYMGIWSSDYETRMLASSDDIHFHVMLGGARYPAAGRISYAFDLRGPSMVVNTACSSSLVTVHLACQSIWSGETGMALAGGINLILEPDITIGGSQAGMLSFDGRCRFGDASASGYVRSEGGGMVILKSYSQALADGDPIHALIRGCASNNDGRAGDNMSSPGLDAQVTVARDAYRLAGIEPHEVGYVEAHGTGTPTGDPIEVSALTEILGENRDPERPCLMGSVKTNIGHTEAAAGIISLIKAALCLKHKQLPKSLHFETPNPRVAWDEIPLKMQQSLTDWPEEFSPAYIAVNSFGVTGSNVHLILEEAHAVVEEVAVTPTRDMQVLPLSGHTPEALAQFMRALQTSAETEPESINDLAYTIARRRTHHAYRQAVTFSNIEELSEALDTALFLADDETTEPPYADEHAADNVVFVFSGMGPQWWAMGQSLLQTEAVFRDAVKACDALFRPISGWSIITEMLAPEAESRVSQADVAQVTNFALQVGLAALWRSWGIQPSAIIGHSAGEVAAAYIAGMLSLEDAVTVIYHRSRLQYQTTGMGKMAALGLSLDMVEAIVSADDYDGLVSVAAVNSPEAITISGDADSVAKIVQEQEARGVFARLLNTEVPYHSPKMEPLKAELFDVLSSIESRPAQLPIYTTVSGKLAELGAYDASYWWQNIRQPVYFAQAMAEAIDDGYKVFLELSPHPVLSHTMRECFQAAGSSAQAVPSLRRKEDEHKRLFTSLGDLYQAGCAVDWQVIYPQGNFTPFPLNPWQHDSLWFELDDTQQRANVRRGMLRSGQIDAHPFLVNSVESALNPGVHISQIALDVAQMPYLTDHKVGQMAVLPGAAYLEIVVSAAKAIFGDKRYELEDVAFSEALFLSENDPRVGQLVLTPHIAGHQFQFLSRPQTTDDAPKWSLHASGFVRISEALEEPQLHAPDIDTLRSKSTATPSAESFYQRVQDRRLNYGPNFQIIEEIWQWPNEALGSLSLADDLQANLSYFGVHPALLDGAIQVFLAALDDCDLDITYDDAYLPVGIDSFRFYSSPDAEALYSYIKIYPEIDPTGNLVVGDLALLDDAGNLYLEIKGMRLQKLAQQTAKQIQDWLFGTTWQEVALDESDATETQTAANPWIIFQDETGTSERLKSELTQAEHSYISVERGSEFTVLADNHYQVNATNRSDFVQLFEHVLAGGQAIQGIIFLWALDAADDEQLSQETLLQAQEMTCIAGLHLVQALATSKQIDETALWLVTQGAQRVNAQEPTLSIAQSPLWGLGKTIALEHAELHCRLVDLDAAEAGSGQLMAELAAPRANHVAYRDGKRFEAYLVREQLPENKANTVVTNSAAQAFQLSLAQAGQLETLALRMQDGIAAAAAGEVCIAVKAAGLNQVDVMSAQSTAESGPILGVECAGIITAVGEGVAQWQIGDEVIAIAKSTLASHVIADADLVAAKPVHLSMSEAAALPLSFVSAYYALHQLGQVAASETVLVHLASRDVGLAAVELLTGISAEIIATVNNPEHANVLAQWPSVNTINLQSASWASDIMALTNGKGVDVIFDTSGERFAIENAALLKESGRLLQLNDAVARSGSNAPAARLSFGGTAHAFRILPLCWNRPKQIGSILQTVAQKFADSRVAPLLVELVSPSNWQQLFQQLQPQNFAGKRVVDFQSQDIFIEAPATDLLESDATYLITGGLGGLGLVVAEWMVSQGARHLVLVGRSSPSAKAQQAIAQMTERGAVVKAAQADVTNAKQLADLFADIDATMPTLRGVFHAAGVLDDATMLTLDHERFIRVMKPKMLGAWHLHNLTKTRDLNLFVLFSSAASLLGLVGQSNYVAANTFLDALAAHRHANMLPALSINWGAWSEVGMAAAQANRGARLSEQGMRSISPEQGVAALEAVIVTEQPQIGVMALDVANWVTAYPQVKALSLFSELMMEVDLDEGSGESAIAAEMLATLHAARPEDQLNMLQQFLHEQVARTLRLPPARISPAASMQSLGVDSLISIELRRSLEIQLGLTLSATLVWNYPTLQEMAQHIAEKLGIVTAQAAQEEAEPSEEMLLAQLETSGEDVMSLLMQVEQLSAEELEIMLSADAVVGD